MAATAAVLMIAGNAFAADQSSSYAPFSAVVSTNPGSDNPGVELMDNATSMPTTTLSTPAVSPTVGDTNKPAVAPSTPAVAAATPPSASPNIHGFFTSSFKTGYLTPRGLYVENKGLVWQPIVGLVLPIGDFGPVKKLTAVGGVWNDVDMAEAGTPNTHTTGGWDEMDPFISLSANVTDELNLNLTYVVFDSPQHNYVAEHNLDLKFSYDDSKCWGDCGFGLHPYLDCWWAISGGSTVVLGRAGGTGYFEPGIVPTYTLKCIPSYPITITIPTYVSVGPRTYWAASGLPGGNFGVFSTSLDASIPLSFIPTQYGYWHMDLGFTYDDLINTSLLHAGTILCGNTDRNVFLGSIAFGFNF
jgi:hypothetical protein